MRPRLIIYLLVILSPFFSIGAYYFGSKMLLLKLLFSGIKDILIVGSIVASICLIKKWQYDKTPLNNALALFALISTFHIVGVGGLLLSIEGIRYSYYYVIWALLSIVLISNISELFDFDVVIKIIAIQFVLLVFLGLYEYYDPEILNKAYGVSSRSELIYAKFRHENRLIATFYNPIIYSAFLCVGVSALYYYIEQKQTRLYWLAFYFLWTLSLFVVIFTYSRLGLITYLVISIMMLIRSALKKEMVAIVMLVIGAFFVVPFVIKLIIENIFLLDRISSLIDLNTFTGNVRVTNWIEALEKFENNPVYYLWGLGLGTSLPGALVKIENGFLTVFFELGVFGFISFTFFMILLLVNILRCKVDSNKRFFLISFFVSFLLMNLGNDFVKVFPISFYFWLFIIAFIQLEKSIILKD
ncbi:O-antigen ligase family protein [Vibrio alfacsensis]|uniref:O-antigen ligase family protein n=1 Tax=Vibrio alfacsensis TaxID=1074311 RepID=UPI0040696328